MVDARLDSPPLDATPQAPERPARMSAAGYARYAWRQLTSMRTALILLFLLAVAAVPGSLLPQRAVNPLQVRDYYLAHPTLAPWVERASGFDVYASPWFAAVYLLLMLSLAGCVLPRAWRHAQAMRARPPATPRNLDRLPEHRSYTCDLEPEAVVAAAAAELRSRRFRVDRTAEPSGAHAVSSEKGFLRETGNLVFHVSMLLLLAGVALGSLYGYKGTVLVVTGDSFVNAPGAYDDFHPGRRFSADSLRPFALTVKRFAAEYVESGDKAGTARHFQADLEWTARFGTAGKSYPLTVNHPLKVDGAKVYLLGNGYAPHVVVRDDSGAVAFDGSVPFLPQDSQLASEGVVKVTSAAPQQIGLTGLFTPTTQLTADGQAVSTFPTAKDPALSLVAYRGDLGLGTGAPQSVYRLDTTRMTRADRFLLRPGQTHTIAGGKATVTFTGYDTWINLQVTYDPGKQLAAAAAGAILLGLLLSLRVRRRRLWVRARPDGAGRTVVEVGGLARTDATGFSDEFAGLVARLESAVPPRPAGQEN